jgi:hypothetical protein
MRPWALLLGVPVMLGACGASPARADPAPATSPAVAPSADASLDIHETASGAPGLRPVATPTPTASPAAGRWVNAGTFAPPIDVSTMAQPRTGEVVAIGWSPCPDPNDDDPGPASIVIGDPLTGAWRSAGLAATVFGYGSHVWLSDGRLLVAGGATADGKDRRETLVYDPATGAWSRVGSLRTARSAPMIALPGGGALIVGGASVSGEMNYDLHASAEAWDPRAGTWSAAGRLSEARSPSLAVLADGRVLAVGGSKDVDEYSVATDIYDPRTGRWTAAADVPAMIALSDVVPLEDGGALVLGMDEDSGDWAAFRLDPHAGTWSRTVSPTLWGVLGSFGLGHLLLEGDAVTIHNANTGVERTLPLMPEDVVSGGSPVPLADGSLLFPSAASDVFEDPSSEGEGESRCVPRQQTTFWRFVPD